VLQELWVKVLRDIRKLKGPGSLRSWLYTITHGIAVDRIRRNASRERAEQAELEELQETEEPSIAEKDSAVIHQCLSQIGFRHREVLVLHFLEDFVDRRDRRSRRVFRRNGEIPHAFVGCRHVSSSVA
jgi:RNA polymerase sigma-70 factor (ECF subfamily)